MVAWSKPLLFVGALLMLLLGLAAGLGGGMLVLQGPSADPDIRASAAVVFGVGIGLSILGTALVVAAIGVFRRQSAFWRAGMVLTLLFLIDGAINGYLLYGSPGDRGTLVNLAAAALIVGCLLAGRSGLR